MSQVAGLLDSFKNTLKSRGLTYRDLAQALELSESSVKRLFSTKALSLERLEFLCEHFDISLSEVIKRANFELEKWEATMSFEQESALARDPQLLALYSLIYSGLRISEILRRYDISKPRCERLLLKLDKLGLIELHLKNKVRLKSGAGLAFKKDGPLGAMLFKVARERFLNDSFSGERDFIRFANIKLTPVLITKLRHRLSTIEKEIEEESRFVRDETPGAVDMGVMLAFRPWHFEQFSALKKK